MPCTAILVGKQASHDGSTIIARTTTVPLRPSAFWPTPPGRGPRFTKRSSPT